MPIRCVLDEARVVACGLPPMGSASRFKHVARRRPYSNPLDARCVRELNAARSRSIEKSTSQNSKF